MRLTLLILTLVVAAPPAVAVDQSLPGAGNGRAAAIAAASPLVQSAQRFLMEQAKRIGDPALRGATLDALGNPDTCIVHRRRLDDAAKAATVDRLVAAGLANAADDAQFPGSLGSGVFPPVRNDGGDC